MRTRTAIAAVALTLVAAPALTACAGDGGLAALTQREQTADGFSDSGGGGSFSDNGGGGSSSSQSDDSGGTASGLSDSSGSSGSSGDNLDVCETLFTDLENISQAITSSSTPGAAASKLGPLKAKLDADSAGGSAAVQKAVDAVNSSLTQLIKDSTAHDVAAAEADAKTYESSFEQLSTACTS